MEVSFRGVGEKFYAGGGDYALDNSDSSTKSYGLEFQADWKPIEDLGQFILGYTKTESHDGTTCDNPDSTGGPGSSACNDEMNVRVPRDQINLSGTKLVNKNLSHTLNIKYVGERRDYGNTNQGFEDVILSKYATFDYLMNYKLFNSYNLSISAKNIFDKKYSEAYEYNAPGRSLNFMLKRATNAEMLKISILIFCVLAFTRLIPHPPNFTSLIAP